MTDRAALEARLDQVEHDLAQLVDERPDDPDLMATVDRLRRALEADAGPHLTLVQERFQCLLGSLGLIPSDNEGQPCHPTEQTRGPRT
jgi:hypothetical protein